MARAVEAAAHLIVTGDTHLDALGGKYNNIPVVTAAEAAMWIGKL